jgi:fructose-1,6-bisphosphatase/inositol monophosphatase family enzyme
MHPWDSGPFAVILPEAGGIFSGWTGQPSIHAGDAIACNPRLHQQVLKLVQPWTDRRAISH